MGYSPPFIFYTLSFISQEEESREYIDEIMVYVRDRFVDGRIATAKSLIVDCVVVAQNRNAIVQLDKAPYGKIKIRTLLGQKKVS